MKYFNFITCFNILFFLFVGCNSNLKNKNSSRIILQIDTLCINEESFLKEFIDENPDLNELKSNRLRNKQIEKWKENYLENCYFLLDAINLGYNSHKEINNKVERYANYSLAKKDGFLWKYREEPKLKISAKEIKDAYKAREKEYYIESIVFLDTAYYFNLVKNKPTFINKPLKDLLLFCEQEKVKYQITTTQYPYNDLLYYPDDLIDSLETNKVIGPYFYKNICLYFHLLRKENIKQKPFNTEKEMIIDDLKKHKSFRIVEENVNQIVEYAQPVYNNINISKFLSIENKCRIEKNSDSLFNNKSPLPLVVYRYKNKLVELEAHRFWSYRKNFYLVMDLNDVISVKNELTNFIIEEYVSDEAKGLKLDTLNAFILKNNLYKHKLMVEEYKNELKKNITNISDVDLLNYYDLNKNNFSGSKNIVVSLLYFNNFEDASVSINNINYAILHNKMNKLSEEGFIKGLVKYIPSDTLSRENNNLSPEFLKGLFNLSSGRSSQVFKIGKFYVLAIKNSETGTIIKPFLEVKDEIERKLKKEYYLKIKSEKIKELKSKYKMQVNLIDDIKL